MSENKKTKYRGFTPAQAEAHKRYMKDFVEIKVRMKADKRTLIQEHAANMGESATAFINRAIDEAIEHDTQKQEESPALELKSEAPHTSQKKPGQFKPFTESDAKKIDITRLPKDIRYQMDIIEVYGRDVLASLLDKARKENKEG